MEDELEYDGTETPEVNGVESMIDAAIQSDFVSANDYFTAALNDKISDALEQEKVRVADSVFNGVDEVDDYEDDFTDEELESMLADVDEEDFDLEDETDLEELLDDEQ